MFQKTNDLVGDRTLIIAVRGETESRLSRTSFRGVQKRLAGNFHRFSTARHLILDPEINVHLVDAAKESYHLGYKVNSTTIQCGSLVGWASSDDVDLYTDDDVELFSPSRKSTALRVKLDRLTLTSPQTDLVTIVYELRMELRQVAVIVHSIYPGVDVGELVGDITKREGVVFFDWDHPGE